MARFSVSPWTGWRTTFFPCGRKMSATAPFFVAENKSGEVLAYVSYSGDPGLAGFVDGVKAKRQAGPP